MTALSRRRFLVRCGALGDRVTEGVLAGAYDI